jgi:uncharacterized protein
VRVTQLWRFPVKSLQGERLDAVGIDSLGIEGDRRWAIFDRETGFGLTARRAPELLLAAARHRDGAVEITLPDGTVAADDEALSTWLGRPVALRGLAEVDTPRYENPEDPETEAPESWRTFTGPPGAYHDAFTVTLLSVPAAHGHDLRRFRANVVVDGGDEDALVGTTVALGGARLQVREGVPRCVMVTRAQPGGIEVDRDVLRWIHRERAGLLSVGAAVVEPGTVRVGDEVARTG